jgi:hypothetical protein
MALFIVRHEHAAERCPATDPYMGATLLNYLSRPNVRKHGLEIQGEAIVRGEHTLYMIVESDDEARIRAFMQPLRWRARWMCFRRRRARARSRAAAAAG